MKDLESQLRKEVERILPEYTELIKANLSKYPNSVAVKTPVMINGVMDILYWDIKEGRFTKLIYTVGVKGGAFCDEDTGFYEEVEYRELIL